MTEVEQPPQNGIDLSAAEDDDNNKARPADIEQDMREMERRKRVEAIMGSKLFREELERIVDSARDSGATGILQQLSDIVGVPSSRVGSVFKASNCLQPINDIRGVESMGYAKGEKILRCKLAAAFRLLDLYGWTQGLGAQITARLKVDQEYFLVNPYGLLYHEITASSLNKVDMQGNVVEQGTTNFGVNKSHFVLHSIVHAARPDIRCAIYIGCSPVVAISSLKTGLLPLTKDACVLGEVTTFQYTGSLYDEDERNKLVRHLGPNSKVMLLNNHGALCCGETIEEAFYAACHIVQACETQLKLLPIGVDNLVLIPEESRKIIYEQSRRPPEDLEKKFAALAGTNTENNKDEESSKKEETATTKVIGQAPKWRVGGAEFEALMRMLDNAGYRTGYIYRHPLIKSEPPKPKNDVELPPAVSSLGYLLEEEELYRQGIWKKGALGKGGDRSRWLNSPNVYQKVEVLETGTPDPKKITKWVAEGSPTHSTPVRIDDPLQFVPVNTNPKEFKRLQQQIKDNRRADKISAGPQSHILEGVTWDEANRIKDATVSSAGDHVVLMGAASKGIIQRGFQHNATVYKAPYAKNPFDNVTDDELNEYKRTVERKKKSIHGEYTDTDFSESEALSSLQTSGAQQTKQTTTTTTAAVSQSEPEDMSEHQVMRIETQQAPVPSQPEVVLSDDQKLYHHTSSSSSFSSSSLNFNESSPLKFDVSSILNFNESSPLNFVHQPTISAVNYYENLKKLQNLCQKYSFLYQQQWWSSTEQDYDAYSNKVVMNLYTIHKIEIYPHYTYPSKPTATINEHSNFKPAYSTLQHSAAKTCSNLDLSSSCLQPYRTVSHYGFNYPLTYMPNVKLQPTFLTTPIELQRQKVISFIRKFNMEAQQHERKQRQQQLDLQKLKALHKKLPVQQPELDLDEVIYQNIIPNSKIQTSIPSLATLETTSSFISVREIQLNNRTSGQSGVTPSIRQRQLSCSNSQHSKTDQEHDENQAHEQHHHHHHRHDSNDLLQSEQFSSLLSISGSYPNPSHHSHDHFTTDSGDNCSSVETQRTKNYLERHFLPIQSAADDKLRNCRADNYDDEDHDPHKPECEQQAQQPHQHHESLPNLKDSSDYHNQKHITLTLNSLKRRASSLSASIKEKPARNTLRSKSKTKLLSSLPLAENSCDNSQSSCGESSSASTTAIEIHINVTIRNNDCIKNLRNHENEFKTKLEKVIDDEINIITRELEEQPQTIRQEITEQCRATNQHENKFNEDIDDLLMLKHLNPTQRCLSAPDSIYLYSREKHSAEHQHDFYSERDSSYCAEADRQHYKADAKHMLQDQHHSNASIPFHDINFVGCGSNNFPNLNSLRYRHTLTLLEHELEMLLNGIIRNMCDCKSKITQISDEIRTATLHVGSLNPNGSNSNTTASNNGSLLNSKIQSKSVKQQKKDIGQKKIYISTKLN